MDRVERAVRAAVRVASWHGIGATDPVVLRDRANLLVHLRPAPVVARIPAVTAIVRPNPEEWLAREIAVAGYAASNGGAVIAPASEVPPGPHCCDGFWMTFSRYAEVTDSPPPGEAIYGRLLRDLHESLAGFPGSLPRLTALTEIPAMIDVVAPRLLAADVSTLWAAYERWAVPLLAESAGVPALHGDSNVHNLVNTPGGWLWSDFEDTGSGPVAWDLACAVCAGAPDRHALLRGYGAAVDGAELDAHVVARDLQAIPWLFVIGTRFPERIAEGHRRLAALPR